MTAQSATVCATRGFTSSGTHSNVAPLEHARFRPFLKPDWPR